MDLDQNDELRQQGWRVFRSASRDHLVPLTGAGSVLQRVKLSEALPVLGVFEGVALSDEERKANAEQDRLALSLAERDAVGRPLGITQYLAADMAVIDGVVDPVNPFFSGSIVGTAPFDGFITEFSFTDTSATPALAVGIRSSGGATMFRSNDPGLAPPPIFRIEPDFVRVSMFDAAGERAILRNLKMPVFAGEEIKAVTIMPAATPLGTFCGQVVLGFEAFILARPGSAAAQSMFGALTVESRRAATEAADQAGRLAIEQERTRRAQLVDIGQTERARLALEAKRAAGVPTINPLMQLLANPDAQAQLTSRLARPPVKPKVPPPKKEPPEGTGKTFVSAWNPSYGNVGYLIPNAPPGGRVNVFDNFYTVWDVTGKMISKGQIEPIATTGEIPPGARISPIRSGIQPSGL
jgi:hypothetical protein